ncbi:MAG: N-acetylmuramoyl-L-alanine amidase [Paracoccaceae bacterium]
MLRAWMHLVLSLWFAPWFAVTAAAQDLSVLARVDVANSFIAEHDDGLEFQLALSQGVPFRVFTLDGPPRLIVDFREVSFDGVSQQALLDDATAFSAMRFGVFRPGWSRIVADLSSPMVLKTAGMPVDTDSGRARLKVVLQNADEATFAAKSASSSDVGWTLEPAPATAPVTDDAFVIVIDPGHGGVDPGAMRGDTIGKDLMLNVGIALRDALRRTGQAQVVMTRDRDVFVSLKARVALAHQMRADLIISLHADTVAQGRARGATVYTLSDEASDAASEQLATQHNRADLIAGLDLSAADDQVTSVLLSLARQETRPRTQQLADALVAQLTVSGGPINRHPQRKGDFSVLRSADIPSVLVELGFMSDERDLKNLQDPDWRAGIVAALARAILEWRTDDLATRALVRQ